MPPDHQGEQPDPHDREDAADDLLLNEVIWRSVRGPDQPMPAPVRAAFVFALEEAEDEEDGE